MKFEAGKFYRCADGCKAVVWMPNNGKGFMFGAVLSDGVWCQMAWALIGKGYEPDGKKLIAEWSEPKPPKLLAPALFRNGKHFFLSSLFESEEDAKLSLGSKFVLWPAKLNSDGFYEVP